MTIKLEDLDRVLTHKDIFVEKLSLGKESIKRVRKFTIRGKVYRVIWYPDVCYLKFEDVVISFYKAIQKAPKLWNDKPDIQFYDKDNRICCVLPKYGF